MGGGMGENEGKWGETLVDGFTSMWLMNVSASCTCVLCSWVQRIFMLPLLRLCDLPLRFNSHLRG